MLKKGNINALGYIILAGTEPGQGSVIAKNHFNVAHEEVLNVTAGKWYLVQTNNDHWVDGGCYNRCAAASERLEAIGQENITLDSLRQDVLNVFPNFNGDTLYGADFYPVDGFMLTYSMKYNFSTDDVAYTSQNYKPEPEGFQKTVKLSDITISTTFDAVSE